MVADDKALSNSNEETATDSQVGVFDDDSTHDNEETAVDQTAEGEQPVTDLQTASQAGLKAESKEGAKVGWSRRRCCRRRRRSPTRSPTQNSDSCTCNCLSDPSGSSISMDSADVFACTGQTGPALAGSSDHTHFHQACDCCAEINSGTYPWEGGQTCSGCSWRQHCVNELWMYWCGHVHGGRRAWVNGGTTYSTGCGGGEEATLLENDMASNSSSMKTDNLLSLLDLATRNDAKSETKVRHVCVYSMPV